jgi:circadian clock protein KaiB
MPNSHRNAEWPPRLSRGPALLNQDHDLTQALPAAETYELRLYVAGPSVKSALAFTNLKEICEQHLKGRYKIELINLLENPQLARGDRILALPTVVRRLPRGTRKITGDLSNRERVLARLDLCGRT